MERIVKQYDMPSFTIYTIFHANGKRSPVSVLKPGFVEWGYGISSYIGRI